MRARELLLAAICLCGPTIACGAAPAPREPVIDIGWTSAPMRSTLAEVAARYGRGLVIDRRVDPGQLLNASLQQVAIDDVFVQAAASRQLEAVKVGSTFFIAQPKVAQSIRTLVALRKTEAQRLPAAAQKAWLTPGAWQWNDLDAPRELMLRLVKSVGSTVKNPELVPHDLWGKASLPSSSAVERLALLLAQFDLTWAFEEQGGAIRLVSVPAKVFVERHYAATGNAQAQAARWRKIVPDAEIEATGKQIIVRGRVEDHEQLTGQGKPTAAAKEKALAGIERFTLSVDQVPLDQLLAALAKKLDKTIEIDQASCVAAGIKVDQLASVHVKQVGEDELISELLKPAGLSFRRDAGKIIVFAPGK